MNGQCGGQFDNAKHREQYGGDSGKASYIRAVRANNQPMGDTGARATMFIW